MPDCVTEMQTTDHHKLTIINNQVFLDAFEIKYLKELILTIKTAESSELVLKLDVEPSWVKSSIVCQANYYKPKEDPQCLKIKMISTIA